jgi:hypothetical protein
MADGPDGPLPDPRVVAQLAGGLAQPEVLLGWVVRAPAWIEQPPVPTTTWHVGMGTRAAVGAGAVRATAARLSAAPGLLAGRLRPAVAVVGAHAGTDGVWRLAGSAGWSAAAAASATVGVVIERWPGPAPRGADPVPGSVLAVIERQDGRDPVPDNHPGPAHHQIASHVAGLIPEGATVQWGPGVVGASVIAALQVPVRVRSGLVTDEVVDLHRRGLLLGTAEAAYVWGGPGLDELVAAGTVALRPVSHTHDLTAISATPGFVAVNTALQVGLDGAANVEVAGGRIVSGPGGHPDFAAGASRSPGGLSIVALAATAGGRSTIVAAPEVVSTPRSDVDVVVTEFGMADLRLCDSAERRRRMVEIAAPEFREQLAEARP